MRIIKVKDLTTSRRLDTLIAGEYPELSRAYLQKLIAKGEVLVNKELSKPGYRLKNGDVIALAIDTAQLQQPEHIELPIIYEDEDVLVVDKPVGVISHALNRYWNEPSVASFVRQKTGQPGERSGIVHRLDRATSGVMICAKNEQALRWLQTQFALRKVNKVYRAIVSGHMQHQEAIVDLPIERNPKHPQTFRVGASGKVAQTHYLVLKSLPLHDIVELKPHTGRTHQLRVHLKHVGNPIVGDTLYGGEKAERLYLHAYSLEITLQNGQRTTLTSPLPLAFNTYTQLHG